MRPKKEEKRLMVPEPVGPRKIVLAAARTEAGRDLLALLAKRCGQFQTSLTRMATGALEPLSTEAKEAQRLIWLELRGLLPVEMRHTIELIAEQADPEKPKGEEDKTDAK